MGKNNQNEDTNGLTVTLLLDDDKELECGVLKIYEIGDKQYIAVQPLSMMEDPEGEVYIYRFHESEETGPVLENIDDDEEFDQAIDAFEEGLDEMDFFDLVEENFTDTPNGIPEA